MIRTRRNLLKNLTQKEPTPQITTPHQPRNKKNSLSPSELEGIKTLIRQVIGEISSPAGLPVEEDEDSAAAVVEEDHNST